METFLHCVFWNAIMATGLGFLAAGSVLFRRPALTHAIWILVLLKLITPAFIQVPIPGYSGYRAANAVGSVATPSNPRPMADGDLALATKTDALSPAMDRNESSAETSRAGGAAQVDLPSTITTNAKSWGWMFVSIETFGALAWFAWVGLRILRFHRLLVQTDPAPEELAGRVAQLARRIGLKKCPEVLMWRTVASPMVWRVGGRARLLLPNDLVAKLDREQLTPILLHELAHLRRGDHWVRCLELVAIGLYWWHPVAWWARRELERVEEQACDAWVLWASSGAGPQYAHALLQTIDFLAEARTLLSPLASGIGRTTFIKRRLSMIVEGNVPRSVSSRGWLIVALLALVLLPFTPAWAANAPSLEEIKAALKQRQEQVQSLYVETMGETTSPYTKDELHKLPGGYRWNEHYVGNKVEYQYAGKGEKRYSHKKQKANDYVRGFNGKSVWIRDIERGQRGGPVQFTVTPEASDDGGHIAMRFVYPEEWQALVCGTAMTGPNLESEHSWDNDLFYYDLKHLHERWNLTASDRIEEFDGTKCAVIHGTIEMLSKDDKGEERKAARHVRGWFDLDHGMALRKWEDQYQGGELKRVVNSHFEQVKPGLWLPKEIEIQSIGSTVDKELPQQYRGKLLLSTKINVTQCTINETTDEFFEPKTHVQPADQIYRVRSKDRIVEGISASDL